MRAGFVERNHDILSIKKQCEMMNISRSTYYYLPLNNKEEEELYFLTKILDTLKRIPFYGYRKIFKELNKTENNITEKKTRRIMRKFGLRAIYPKRNLSKPRKDHKKYPYLLKNKRIWLPNQVWATDITYCRLNGCYVYLIAIIDIFSRRVLSWRLSNTMDASFCVEALEEAIMFHGVPSIFNTDQGSQFTSDAFTSVLENNNIQISMDSVGRALDNIYVERLWRTVKYEEIYLKDYKNLTEMKKSISKYFHFYNTERFHQSLEYKTPEEKYFEYFKESKEAA